ncbi:MAG: GHKL domain-containing protein [Oscillospiraceae bacterium]|nr:GHKL domain-containing protein [Oscillospiraceae bacterium]
MKWGTRLSWFFFLFCMIIAFQVFFVPLNSLLFTLANLPTENVADPLETEPREDPAPPANIADVPTITSLLAGTPKGVMIPAEAVVVDGLDGLRAAPASQTLIALRLTADTDMGAMIDIAAGRTVHIFSATDAIDQAFALTKDSESPSRHFTVSGHLYLWNVSLTRTSAALPDPGGGVSVIDSGHLHMQNGSTISNNRAASGGGIYLQAEASATINDGATIRGNVATGSDGGGGIFASAGAGWLRIYGGTIGGIPEHVRASFPRETLWTDANPYANRAATRSTGGGIRVDDRNFLMYGGSIIGNRVEGTANSNSGLWGGGGIAIHGALTGGRVREMRGGTISYNQIHVSGQPGHGGGGLYIVPGAAFTMTGGSIRNNFSNQTGGGVQLGGSGASGNSRFTMTGAAQIAHNFSRSAGGGVQLNSDATLIMRGHATIDRNRATGGGGGVRLYSNNILELYDEATISYNHTTAGNGGGVSINTAAGTLRMHGNSAIHGNTAKGNGGGIYADNMASLMVNGFLADNTAARYGNEIYIRTASTGRTVEGVFAFLDWTLYSVQYFLEMILIALTGALPVLLLGRRKPSSRSTMMIRRLSLFVLTFGGVFGTLIVLDRISIATVSMTPFVILLFLVTLYILAITLYEKHLLAIAKAEQEQIEQKSLLLYTDELEQQQVAVRKFKHDFQNILLSLDAYIQDQDLIGLDDYFSSKVRVASDAITKDEFALASLSKIKVREIKSILTAKLILAQNTDVDIHTTVEVNEEIDYIPVGSVALVRMLGILLDNAIEALAELGGGDLRVSCLTWDAGITFAVQNTCSPQVPPPQQLWQMGFSTKGKGRGLGLSNLSELVDAHPNVTLGTTIGEHTFKQELLIEFTEERKGKAYDPIRFNLRG